jgi:kynurenine formamidase
MRRWTVVVGILAFLVGFAAARRSAAPVGLDALTRGSWTDLSHPFDSATIYWPTSTPFTLTVRSAGVTAGGFYYAANDFAAAEHGGTHLDAPVHFGEGKHTADRIPLERLIGPAVVIAPARRLADTDRDYLMGAGDLTAWEAAHGPLPAGAIVLLHTGWGRYWSDRARYLGTAATGAGAVAELHFPGLDPRAARLLVERNIRAVGIDTPSIDYGQSTTFDAHRVFAAANVPIFENVAGLDALPATGAFVVALPMKIAGGTGGPLRVAAWVP